jgi:hypothetical protein
MPLGELPIVLSYLDTCDTFENLKLYRGLDVAQKDLTICPMSFI